MGKNSQDPRRAGAGLTGNGLSGAGLASAGLTGAGLTGAGPAGTGLSGPRLSESQTCPCGSRSAYGRCCGPLHAGEEQAATAEALMRSRFAAYAIGDLDYIFRTWHPRTRPSEVTDGGVRWLRLQIVDVVAGGAGDDEGEVEFIASYDEGGRPGEMRERSRFARRAGRWFYLAETTDTPVTPGAAG